MRPVCRSPTRIQSPIANCALDAAARGPANKFAMVLWSAKLMTAVTTPLVVASDTWSKPLS